MGGCQADHAKPQIVLILSQSPHLSSAPVQGCDVWLVTRPHPSCGVCMAVQCPPTLGQPRPWLLRLVPGYLMPLPEPDEARGALLPARSPSMILFYPAPSSTPRIIPLYRSRRCCAPPIFLLFSFAASDHALFTAQLAWLLTLF